MSTGRRFLGLEHQVALIVAEISTLAQAYPKLLETIGISLGWDFGAVWKESLEPSGFVRCAATWCADPGRLAEFARVSLDTALPPGAGLPGRVWSSVPSAWITDVQADPNFPRRDAAAQAGLHAAFCFPIRTARGVVGAIEFLTSSLQEQDDDLLGDGREPRPPGRAASSSVSRRRGARCASARRDTAGDHSTLALDCDRHHRPRRARSLAFNAAAERTFGYTADEVDRPRDGRDLIDCLPRPARPATAAGFARYLETGDARNPRPPGRDHRHARRRGPSSRSSSRSRGSPCPGTARSSPATVRDITEREGVLSEELRASRARLVAAAQNDGPPPVSSVNLHDGAQQRLVSLALTLRLARDGVPEQDGQTVELLERAQEGAPARPQRAARAGPGNPSGRAQRARLAPALEGVAARSTVPVELAALPDERLPEPIEAAVYYVVCEALVNVAKHANATNARVSVAQDDGRIVVEVSDDGAGGADAAHGSGLRGLADRVEALDGRLVLMSEESGTTLRAAIPPPLDMGTRSRLLMVIGSALAAVLVLGVALKYATRSRRPDTVVVPGVRGGGFPFRIRSPPRARSSRGDPLDHPLSRHELADGGWADASRRYTRQVG